MLSFLYRLAREYEQEHGYRANRLYLGHRHYVQLRSELAAIDEFVSMPRFLGMEIILSEDCLHPHIAWRAHEADGRAAAM